MQTRSPPPPPLPRSRSTTPPDPFILSPPPSAILQVSLFTPPLPELKPFHLQGCLCPPSAVFCFQTPGSLQSPGDRCVPTSLGFQCAADRCFHSPLLLVFLRCTLCLLKGGGRHFHWTRWYMLVIPRALGGRDRQSTMSLSSAWKRINE